MGPGPAGTVQGLGSDLSSGCSEVKVWLSRQPPRLQPEQGRVGGVSRGSPGLARHTRWPLQRHGTTKAPPAGTAECHRLAKKRRVAGGARRQRREPREETEAGPTLAFPKSPALPEACLNQGNDKRPACVISRQRRGPSGPGDFNTARCLRMFTLILLIWSKQTNYVRF